jgi:F-type H+-transporting ATPase subunit a
MGEHGTWFDYLNRFSWWTDFNHKAEELLGRKWQWMMFQDSHFTLVHVLVTLLVLGFVAWGAISFTRGLASPDGGLVPARRMNLRNFFEMLAEALYGLVEGAMGAHNARRFYPLIGTLFIFVLFGNVIGLFPGFVSSNDTIKTNAALALSVFALTHYYGVREQGLGNYLKHFAGPVLWLAPLMMVIEVISHIARPISLTFRLMGNMVADHKVLFTFTTLVPFLVPLPFYLLGLLICFVQALVFCMLSMVYLGAAVEHEEH